MSNFLIISASAFVANKQFMQPHENGSLCGWALKIPRTYKTRREWGNEKALNYPEYPCPRDQKELIPSSFDSNTCGCCEDQNSPGPQWEGQKFALKTSWSLQPRKMDGRGCRRQWGMRNDAALALIGFWVSMGCAITALKFGPATELSYQLSRFLSHRSSCPP